MALKANFTTESVKKYIIQQTEKFEKMVLSALTQTGLRFVENARTNGNYIDRTGNLRNSIGFMISRNGQVIDSDFKKSAKITITTKTGKTKTGKGSKDGIERGKQIAIETSTKFSNAYVLVVVAGMEYAVYVESKGKEVITGSSQLAEIDLKKYLAMVKSKTGQTIPVK